MSDLATRPSADIAQAQVDPTIQWAMSNGATPEMLRELYQLQREMRADQARGAFNEAMARFKADPPHIAKNKHVQHNNFWHATLDECVAKITPSLAAVGIRHRWDIDQSKSPSITVTCVLSHALGHSEATPLTATADKSGSKNEIQAVGSAVTYLQRYTLLSATGLAAGGTDDDGRASGRQEPHVTLNEEEVVARLDAIRNAQDVPELERMYKPANAAAEKVGDKAAGQAFSDAKNKRYRELRPRA